MIIKMHENEVINIDLQDVLKHKRQFNNCYFNCTFVENSKISEVDEEQKTLTEFLITQKLFEEEKEKQQAKKNNIPEPIQIDKRDMINYIEEETGFQKEWIERILESMRTYLSNKNK